MTQSSWIGKTLNNRYEIVELLGQGGMSAVYKANDPNLRRVVAVKIIHEHLSTDPEFVRRFEEEAAGVAQLRHPNLIQVFDFNNHDNVYYIVFEFVPGESLQARLKRLTADQRLMPVDEAVEIAAKVADGLHYAHNKGLIHRDVKPANIMINVYGEPIVMDFGIAKIMGGTQHTATGAVLGTARYMSPEQIKGERIDPRTDLYSLGVTLFEMLGGRPPFEANSAMTLMMMHMTDPIPDLRNLRGEVAPGLVSIVNKALAKERANRYQNGAEMAQALRHYGQQDTGAMAPTVVEPLPEEPSPADRTVVDTGSAAALSTGTAARPQPEMSVVAPPVADTGSRAAQAPPPAAPPPRATETGSGGGKRNLFLALGAVAVVVVIGLLAWAFLGRDTGPAENEAVAAQPSETPDLEATQEAREAEISTRVAVAAQETADAAAAASTDTPEPTATDEPTATATVAESTEEAGQPPASTGPVGVQSVEGTVRVVNEAGEEMPLDDASALEPGAGIATGADGSVTLTLPDETILQIAEDTRVWLEEIATEPADYEAESVLRVIGGDVLLRQPAPGNVLAILSENGTVLGTLQHASTPEASRDAKEARLLARRSAQTGDEAVMAVAVGPIRARLSCFAGTCARGGGSTIRTGWETVVTVEDAAFISSFPLTTSSEAYTTWYYRCDDCMSNVEAPLPPTATRPTSTPTRAAVTATPTLAFTATPTLAYTATPTTAAVTATPTEPPTMEASPTATEEAAADYSSRITDITLNENGVYIVSYDTFGFVETLPGRHVHFYFDTVPESEAGVPGGGPWKLYGGPRPFTGYTVNDRPPNATAMCIRVANEDHSIIYGTGNCYPLP